MLRSTSARSPNIRSKLSLVYSNELRPNDHSRRVIPSTTGYLAAARLSLGATLFRPGLTFRFNLPGQKRMR